MVLFFFFFFQAEDGIRDADVTGVQTCALPIWRGRATGSRADDDRRARVGLPEELVQDPVVEADTPVRDGPADRPRLVRAVNRDRPSLRPAPEHVRVRRDADCARPPGPRGV